MIRLSVIQLDLIFLVQSEHSLILLHSIKFLLKKAWERKVLLWSIYRLIQGLSDPTRIFSDTSSTCLSYQELFLYNNAQENECFNSEEYSISSLFSALLKFNGMLLAKERFVVFEFIKPKKKFGSLFYLNFTVWIKLEEKMLTLRAPETLDNIKNIRL